MVCVCPSGRMASPSGILLLPSPPPRYRSRSTGQAHLGLRPCGKGPRRCLPKCPCSGSWFFQKTSGGWHPVIDLSPERVRPSYSVHDGDSSFCTVICQRRGFSSFPGSEGCLPSDPNSSFLEEAMGFTSEGTVTSSTPCFSDSRLLPRSALRS